MSARSGAGTMGPTKVGIITGVYEPEIGGSATYLRRLRADLLAQGDRVEVVTFGETRSEPGIARVPRRLPLPLRLAVYAYWIARVMRDADIWFVNENGLVAAILAPMFRRPMFMKVVGDWAWQSSLNRGFTRLSVDPRGEWVDPLVAFQRDRQPLRAAVLRWLRSVAARAMDRVVVPSHYLAEVVASWGVERDRIDVVPNGIDIEDVPPSRSPSGDPTILTAARLVTWKGIDHLIRAFATVRSRIPAARLVVLGDGPERARLQELARALQVDRAVEFGGHVPRSVVLRRLSSADVFALPSAYEGLPHVVLEALAAGCPVVAGAAGGTVEVIRDGLDGLLVRFGDTEALATALERLLTDPAFASQLGERGRRRVADAYSWSTTSDVTIRLLHRMTLGPPRPKRPEVAP